MDLRSSGRSRFPQSLMEYFRELRARIHRYRRLGLLPEGRALRLLSHRGSGRRCLICGEPVMQTEPEIVAIYEPDPELAPESPTYRFHQICHVVWMVERRSTPPPLTRR